MEKRNVSVKEFAKIVGVSNGHAYNLCKSGQVKTLKLGRRILVPILEVERILNL